MASTNTITSLVTTPSSIQASDTSSQPRLELQLLEGSAVGNWMARPDNRHAWTNLLTQCAWSTAFQSPRFADVWYRHYSQWTPLLLIARSEAHALVGVMPLAARSGIITGAGAHQAEYHGWICSNELAFSFGVEALKTLSHAHPEKALRLRYIPPAFPASELKRIGESNRRIILLNHRSHELSLDAAHITASLRKKSNKSKLNRLKRGGEIHVRRLDADGLAPHFRRIVAMYDARQGATNGVCPFGDDPKKAAFHLEWLRSAPDQHHVTAMFVDRELCSALWLVVSGTDAHLGISAYAPEFAAHSPIKFHLYQAAQTLISDGRQTLDLTPGADPWKERFSTGARDVWELTMYPSLAEVARKRFAKAAKDSLRKGLASVGLDPARIRRQLASLRSNTAVTHHPEGKGVVHRLAPSVRVTDIVTPVVAQNDLTFALQHGSPLVKLSRQAFLKNALARIEAGEEFLGVNQSGKPIALAWRSQGSAPRIYDIHIGPNTEARSVLVALIDYARKTSNGGAQALAFVVPQGSPLRRDLIDLGCMPEN